MKSTLGFMIYWELCMLLQFLAEEVCKLFEGLAYIGLAVVEVNVGGIVDDVKLLVLGCSAVDGTLAQVEGIALAAYDHQQGLGKQLVHQVELQ